MIGRGECQGRIELPTNPESFRGCSIVANNRSRAWGFPSVSRFAPTSGPRQACSLPSWRQFRVGHHAVAWWPYDRANVGRIVHQGRRRSQCNADHSNRGGYRPKACGRKCQGGELNSRPRAYESPALPLSYPGIRGKFNTAARAPVNAGTIIPRVHALSFFVMLSEVEAPLTLSSRWPGRKIMRFFDSIRCAQNDGRGAVVHSLNPPRAILLSSR